MVSQEPAHDPAALLAAATRLGAKGPFTLAALARFVGLSRATLYRHVDAPLRRRLEVLGLQAGQGEEGRRAQVLAGLRESLEAHGFEAFTVEDVARRAGVGVATVYRQFGDRDGLLRALLKVGARRERAWALATGEALDPEAQLAGFAASVLTAIAPHRGLLRAGLAAAPAVRRRLVFLRDAREGSLEALVAYFGRLGREGRLDPTVDPREAATAFVTMLFGYALAPTEDLTGEPPVDGTARLIARLFVRGLGAGGRA